jgi:hypothetical protein
MTLRRPFDDAKRDRAAQYKEALTACPKIMAATRDSSRPAPEKIKRIFSVSTSTFSRVARDIARANAAIIASSEPAARRRGVS